MRMHLSEIAGPLGGYLIGLDVEFNSVATDTRNLLPGALFVALRGARFNGREFVEEACEQGARAALVDTAVETQLPQLVVADTRRALGKLAGLWRQRWPVRLAAITGSNGKTTVKEMLASILGHLGPVVATQGNLNNDIGLPLTLLRLSEETRYVVAEMGANHSGEIRWLSRLARPQVVLITQAGQAHLEGFGSLEGVAQAKGEILEGLAADGVAVLNRDDRFFPLWQDLAKPRHVCTFGANAKADLRLLEESVSSEIEGERFVSRFIVDAPQGEFSIELPLAGKHNVMNAVAASAVSYSLDVDLRVIQAGLASMAPVPGRLELRWASNGALVIDDTYNANPTSVYAALEVLSGCPGERWLVLSDMGELGPDAVEWHRQIGKSARRLGVERLFTTGELSCVAVDSFGGGAAHYANPEKLIEAILAAWHGEVSVLVKGSRAQRMERVIHALGLKSRD